MITTFCGHSEIANQAEIYNKLYFQIENVIKNGCDKFLLGGYGAFDIMAAKAVKELKAKYPHINSCLVIPYLDRDYDTDLYDETIYPELENVPLRFAISKRNKNMIDKSDVVIAFVQYSWSGAATALNYAKRKNKIIYNIAEKP